MFNERSPTYQEAGSDPCIKRKKLVTPGLYSVLPSVRNSVLKQCIKSTKFFFDQATEDTQTGTAKSNQTGTSFSSDGE